MTTNRGPKGQPEPKGQLESKGPLESKAPLDLSGRGEKAVHRHHDGADESSRDSGDQDEPVEHPGQRDVGLGQDAPLAEDRSGPDESGDGDRLGMPDVEDRHL